MASYVIGCCTKHFNSFSVLFVGRIFCGVATSLLFSAFESWLVAEHFSVAHAPPPPHPFSASAPPVVLAQRKQRGSICGDALRARTPPGGAACHAAVVPRGTEAPTSPQWPAACGREAAPRLCWGSVRERCLQRGGGGALASGGASAGGRAGGGRLGC